MAHQKGVATLDRVKVVACMDVKRAAAKDMGEEYALCHDIRQHEIRVSVDARESKGEAQVPGVECFQEAKAV